MKRISLGIALTSNCNKKCFYCSERGENRGDVGTLDFEHLKCILTQAYLAGITTFRITGGEPTLVNYLQDLMEFIMNLDDNTQIRLNTNGYRLAELVNVLAKYRNRINVLISVDSLNQYVNGIKFCKYLSPQLENLVKNMVHEGIKVRFNVVVTKLNKEEVCNLINKSFELKVNVKLLELNLLDEYFGVVSKVTGEHSREYANSLYQTLEIFKEYLSGISDEYKESFDESNSYGNQMSAYFKGENWVQLKQISGGSCYTKYCENECKFFELCQEGIFSPFISVGEILHVSGCRNSNYYWKLKGKSALEIQKDFYEILQVFENVKLIKK